MTRNQVQKIIEDAEIEFQHCWTTISGVKSGDLTEAIANGIFQFQPRLAKAIFRLENAYNKNRAEEKLLSRKPGLNGNWRKRRISLLERFGDALNGAIDVGKVLGDSFAWIFYQKERDLLKKHYERVAIPRFPTGTGGEGEIRFIESAPKFGEYMVLYHGTTTFLRLGDVSLINLKEFNVAAIGELKSHKASDSQMIVSVTLIGSKLDKTLLPPPVQSASTQAVPPPLKPDQLARFQRQVTTIKNSFKPSFTRAVSPQKDLNVTWNIDKLDTLYAQSHTRRFSYIKADRGLLLCGLKLKRSSLWATLFSNKRIDFKKKIEDIAQSAVSIVDKNLPDNSLTTGFLLYPSRKRYCLTQWMRPLLWWPLKQEAIEALLFRRFIVMTLFNPAFLIRQLRELGFSVTCKDGSLIEISKPFRGELMYFEGFMHYIDLIEHYLFPEDAITALVEHTTATLDTVPLSFPARVHLDVNFMFN